MKPPLEVEPSVFQFYPELMNIRDVAFHCNGGTLPKEAEARMCSAIDRAKDGRRTCASDVDPHVSAALRAGLQ
jgi:hypothetical protein